MYRRNDNSGGPPLPPRIKAAFDYLEYARMVTAQYDEAIEMRELSPLEKSVQSAALRAVQHYLLGEMDFAEAPAASKPKDPDEGDGSAPAPTGCTT